MAEISASIDRNGRTVTVELANAGERVRIAVIQRTRHFGQLLQTRVKANAATGFHPPGRPHIPGTGPGPNIATSEYNRSIGFEFVQFSDGVCSAQVGTNQERGRRLELGFEGTDALGRRVSSPPYPHFGPAMDWVEGPFIQSIAQIGETF